MSKCYRKVSRNIQSRILLDSTTTTEVPSSGITQSLHACGSMYILYHMRDVQCRFYKAGNIIINLNLSISYFLMLQADNDCIPPKHLTLHQSKNFVAISYVLCWLSCHTYNKYHFINITIQHESVLVSNMPDKLYNGCFGIVPTCDRHSFMSEPLSRDKTWLKCHTHCSWSASMGIV